MSTLASFGRGDPPAGVIDELDFNFLKLNQRAAGGRY